MKITRIVIFKKWDVETFQDCMISKRISTWTPTITVKWLRCNHYQETWFEYVEARIHMPHCSKAATYIRHIETSLTHGSSISSLH